MIWLTVVGAVSLLVVGVVAWFYPQLKARAAATRSAARFGALATELGVELAPGERYADEGFMPTVESVFGDGELDHVIAQVIANERIFLFEYRFGRRSTRRGVAVVAVRLAKPVTMFTLNRPRAPARSRTTEFEARGQPLVVQALGELELWSMKRDEKRVRAMVEPLVAELEPGWDIRGVDDWLVMFNDKHQHDLRRFFERAVDLRERLRA